MTKTYELGGMEGWFDLHVSYWSHSQTVYERIPVDLATC